MQFTSTTEIVKKGAKILNSTEEIIVLKNNNFLGLYLGGELGKAILDSGLLQQIREELWELNDPETVETIQSYRNGDMSDSISLEDFRSKYNV